MGDVMHELLGGMVRQIVREELAKLTIMVALNEAAPAATSRGGGRAEAAGGAGR